MDGENSQRVPNWAQNASLHICVVGCELLTQICYDMAFSEDINIGIDWKNGMWLSTGHLKHEWKWSAVETKSENLIRIFGRILFRKCDS